MIERYSERYTISGMCAFYGVSRSGYYDWLHREHNESKDLTLRDQIAECQRRHKYRYGYRRVGIWLEREHGLKINHKAVLRVMNKYRLLARIRRRSVYRHMQRGQMRYANILDREFTAERPNRKWVTDITYIKTREGTLYLSAIEDLHTNFVISYAMDVRMDYALVDRTLKAAKQSIPDTRGLLLHSDQGCQYTSFAYRDQLKEFGIIPSMSRPGMPHDNACIENFFGVLKAECLYREKLETLDDARQLVDEFIDYYNYERIQTKFRMTPFEMRCGSAA